ncbi:MAG: N-acetyltransferase [Acidimicrobiia bacterium]
MTEEADNATPTAFVPAAFSPPDTMIGDGYRLEPLGPEHNERDYAAWMPSVAFIHTLPGFVDSTWPAPMSLEENLSDLEGHNKDFVDQTGFTYSILDGMDVIGCLYIYPTSQPGYDAEVRSWVTEERASMDDVVRTDIAAWISEEWPFAHPFIP